MSGAGYKGVLTIGSAVTAVRDLTLNLDATEIDDTSRASGGWRSRRAGLRSWGASFEMVVNNGDARLAAIADAYEAGNLISGVIISDGLGNSVTGNVAVTQFQESQPLDDSVRVQISLVGNGAPTAFSF